MADALPDEIRAVLREIVHAAIDTGAMCQRVGSFTEAASGIPVRSVHDAMTDRAVAAILSVWQVRAETSIRRERRAMIDWQWPLEHMPDIGQRLIETMVSEILPGLSPGDGISGVAASKTYRHSVSNRGFRITLSVDYRGPVQDD